MVLLCINPIRGAVVGRIASFLPTTHYLLLYSLFLWVIASRREALD